MSLMLNWKTSYPNKFLAFSTTHDKKSMKNLSSLILAILAISVLAVSTGCSSAGKVGDEVQDYVSSLYPGWTIQGEPQIMDYDSDGDGYVSADVRIKNPTTGEEKMLALSCAKLGSLDSGCKARVGGMSQN